MSTSEAPSGYVYAPFTGEQQEQFDRSQVFGHGFTCGQHSTTPLVAHEDALHCPKCPTAQRWMFAWQADREYLDRLEKDWQW